MPTYRYRARTPEGETVTGTMEGDSASAVAQELSRGRSVPLEISETASGGGGVDWQGWIKRIRREKVPLEDLILFTRQMATLLRAGVPLLRALAGQVESAPNERLREALQGTRETVESGQSLSDGLAQYPDVFSEIFIHMIRVGEASGSLEEVFGRLSAYLEQEKNTRDRTKQALRYPTMVVVAIAVAFVILNVVVIPKFVDMFSGFDTQLPLPTRILIGLSAFTRSYGWLLLIGLVAGGWLFRRYIETDRGRRAWDRWKLKLPIVGDILYKLALGRFTRTFATTSSSGVPVVEGLNVVSRAVGNRFVGDHVEAMRDGVERGDSLYNTARREGLFPLTVLQMIEVGEETGAVDEMMERVAEYYEREVDIKIDNLSSSIEPVLITVIGAMVLLLALGIFLPMWNMSQAIG
jgi:MSHA biogenesis protein MshG